MGSMHQALRAAERGERAEAERARTPGLQSQLPRMVPGADHGPARYLSGSEPLPRYSGAQEVKETSWRLWRAGRYCAGPGTAYA